MHCKACDAVSFSLCCSAGLCGPEGERGGGGGARGHPAVQPADGADGGRAPAPAPPRRRAADVCAVRRRPASQPGVRLGHSAGWRQHVAYHRLAADSASRVRSTYREASVTHSASWLNIQGGFRNSFSITATLNIQGGFRNSFSITATLNIQGGFHNSFSITATLNIQGGFRNSFSITATLNIQGGFRNSFSITGTLNVQGGFRNSFSITGTLNVQGGFRNSFSITGTLGVHVGQMPYASVGTRCGCLVAVACMRRGCVAGRPGWGLSPRHRSTRPSSRPRRCSRPGSTRPNRLRPRCRYAPRLTRSAEITTHKCSHVYCNGSG